MTNKALKAWSEAENQRAAFDQEPLLSVYSWKLPVEFMVLDLHPFITICVRLNQITSDLHRSMSDLHRGTSIRLRLHRIHIRLHRICIDLHMVSSLTGRHDISSCSTQRDVFSFGKKTRLLVQQEIMTTCS